MARINEAKRVLVDERERQQYDAKRSLPSITQEEATIIIRHVFSPYWITSMLYVAMPAVPIQMLLSLITNTLNYGANKIFHKK
jgi:hypothetical protein